MSHTIYAGNVAKRKNSTLQPSLTASFDVLLKTPTSLHTPTFTINAGSFDYNYLKWNDRYYFVTDVVSKNNNLWEVSAVVDVLATYKAEILASTQFVSYSSVQGNAWLADTRIPLLKNATVSQASTTMNFLFNETGFYVLSTVGKTGCDLWALDSTHLSALLDRVNDWSDDLIDDVLNVGYTWDADDMGVNFASLGEMLTRTGVVGNAYSQAPNCIRSCIWVPFFATFFTSGSAEINLGQFPTGVTTFKCMATPAKRSVTINIPWQHTDWRRTVCEEVYLYLPLVGMVSIPSDEIVNESALTIEWSATATDGCIAYLVKAGNQVVGTFGANAAVNYPLGINQQASAGEIVQSVFNTSANVVSSGIQAAGGYASGNAIGMAHGITGLATSAISGAYNTANTALSRHNTCIGGIGGGAGVGLDLTAKCFTVSHDTIVTPSAMVATMGQPTMKPLTLSSCSGYCQCANAHVAAAADSQELDAIDAFLNSGFYIE